MEKRTKDKRMVYKCKKVKMLDLDAVNALTGFKLSVGELQTLIDYITDKKNWKKMKVMPYFTVDLTTMIKNGDFGDFGKPVKGWGK